MDLLHHKKYQTASPSICLRFLVLWVRWSPAWVAKDQCPPPTLSLCFSFPQNLLIWDESGFWITIRNMLLVSLSALVFWDWWVGRAQQDWPEHTSFSSGASLLLMVHLPGVKIVFVWENTKTKGMMNETYQTLNILIIIYIYLSTMVQICS